MKSSFFSLSHWFSALFALAFPLFADYIVTVQNGPQPLFQHPVSVELTAEQTAFVQAGIYLEEVSEDGNDLLDLLDYTLDTMRIIFIGFLTPIVLFEALRLLRRWLLWSFNGLGHFK